MLDLRAERSRAVMGKLREKISEEGKESLIEELKSIDLSEFVGQAASCICEAQLKHSSSSDFEAALQVCSLLHQRYKEFSPHLLKTGRNSRVLRRRSTALKPSEWAISTFFLFVFLGRRRKRDRSRNGCGCARFAACGAPSPPSDPQVPYPEAYYDTDRYDDGMRQKCTRCTSCTSPRPTHDMLSCAATSRGYANRFFW